jgi:hypothetical protein
MRRSASDPDRQLCEVAVLAALAAFPKNAEKSDVSPKAASCAKWRPWFTQNAKRAKWHPGILALSPVRHAHDVRGDGTDRSRVGPHLFVHDREVLPAGRPAEADGPAGAATEHSAARGAQNLFAGDVVSRENVSVIAGRIIRRIPDDVEL